MKATIFTLVLAGFIAVSNINPASGKNKIYTNTVNENNTKTTTAYLGNNDQNLKQKSKCEIKYDETGSPLEKTVYIWNTATEDWNPISKYQYTYSDNKTLECVSHTRWDKKSKEWNNEITQIYYSYNSDSKFLTITK